MKHLYLVIFLFVLSCCGQQLPPIPGNVKVYEMREDKGGLIRLQVNETLPFLKGKGFLCASPQHFSSIVSCTGGGVKVYQLQPQRGGIYRAQDKELKTYAQARGYLCTSPEDMNYILEKC